MAFNSMGIHHQDKLLERGRSPTCTWKMQPACFPAGRGLMKQVFGVCLCVLEVVRCFGTGEQVRQQTGSCRSILPSGACPACAGSSS